MNTRQALLTSAIFAVTLGAIFTIGKSIPVIAAPPLSTAVSIADPNNPTQQAAVDSFGHFGFVPNTPGGGQIGGATGAADGLSNGNVGMFTQSNNYVYNGTTWDRLRGTANAGMSVAPYGVNMVPQNASSGIQANAVATATLPGTAGKTTYLAGWNCSNNGATAALTLDVTVTGIVNTFNKLIAVPVINPGAAGNANEVYSPPVPASAPNTAIVVSMPATGAGGTQAECHAWGFQL